MHSWWCKNISCLYTCILLRILIILYLHSCCWQNSASDWERTTDNICWYLQLRESDLYCVGKSSAVDPVVQGRRPPTRTSLPLLLHPISRARRQGRIPLRGHQFRRLSTVKWCRHQYPWHSAIHFGAVLTSGSIWCINLLRSSSGYIKRIGHRCELEIACHVIVIW